LYIVDTSVWIRHFSSADPFDLRSVCSPDERALCLPVYQEILQGIRDESVFRLVRTALDAAVMVEDPMERRLFLEAAALYRLARRRGLTIRSSVDTLIAACALRHNLTVLHHDRDFSLLSSVSQLKATTV